jgi:tRNA pseudouridine38-40 synthase
MELAYNGAPFNGWQIQPDAPTIQQELETALSTILRVKTNIVGCGRTDSGVHASQFFAHFESSENLNSDALVFKLNCMISREVAVFRIFSVSSDLHARFSATARTYHYFINQVKDAFYFNQSWFMHADLDVESMNKACEHLLGKQDFTSFSKLHTQTRTNLCTISKAEWKVDGKKLRFEIRADRFLHNMVRSIVGTSIDVGKGKINPDDFKAIIEAKDRQKAGTSVPAQGLFLAKITYPGLG